MSEIFCPCCGRHCPLTNPSSERGAAYAENSATDVQNDDAEVNCHKRRHFGKHRHNHEHE